MRWRPNEILTRMSADQTQEIICPFIFRRMACRDIGPVCYPCTSSWVAVLTSRSSQDRLPHQGTHFTGTSLQCLPKC